MFRAVPILLLATACSSPTSSTSRARSAETTTPTPAESSSSSAYGSSQTSPMTSETTQPAAPTSSKSSMWSDAAIYGALAAVHQGELDAADAALAKVQRAETKEFARMMKSDHASALTKQKDTLARLGMAATDIAPTTQLKSDMSSYIASFKSLPVAQSDASYLQKMIAGHQDVLKMIDGDFLPNAKGAELVSILQELRPKVAAHLDHARAALRTIQAEK